MLTREKKLERDQVEMLCIEDLVPKDHLLRDIDKAIDFDFIYDDIFEYILLEAVKCGSVDAKAIFIDATHVKQVPTKNL